MKIQITLTCPQCKTTSIVKNGKKTKKQNYLCNACSRQFIGDHALSYKGAHSNTITLIISVGERLWYQSYKRYFEHFA